MRTPPSRLPRFVSFFLLGLFALLNLVPTPAEAYNPPVDEAGPLTVRIEFPEVVDQIGVPVEGHILLENRGKDPVDGELTLGVIDRWTVNPAGPTRFHVDAADTGSGQTKPAVTKIPFTATAGEGTYSGTDGGNAIYYPIHARASFMLDGEKKTAHPIHLLRTTFPQIQAELDGALPPQVWKSLSLESNRRLRLLGEKTHRTFIAPRDPQKQPILKPIGFNGTDTQTGAASAIGYRHEVSSTERVVMSHPPYQAGLLGTVVREYPVQLPKDGPIRLDFKVAVTAEGQGDGVTFRVRVAAEESPEGSLGEPVFERHSTEKVGWDDCTADLSRFAGKTVRIQLETDPGPDGNTGWDSCFWSQLLLSAGTPAPERPFPPADTKDFHRLGTIRSCDQTYTIELRPGNRGLLDADVAFCREDGEKLFFRGFQIYYSDQRIDSGETSTRLLDTTTRTEAGLYETRHKFLGDHGPMELTIRLFIKDDTLKTSFDIEHEKFSKKNVVTSPAANGNAGTSPTANWTSIHLQDIATGPWSVKAEQVYHGVGNVVRNPQSYRLGFDGHSQAASFFGLDFENRFSMVQAVDNAPIALEVLPEERHYSLHVPYCPTFTFIPTHNAFQGAKRWREVNGLTASAGVPDTAGRFVFDLWGGHYDDSCKQLEKAFRYGLTDSMVVWHNWQRWGYDYRLPEICPPNPQLGTEEEMQRLIQSCKTVGVPFALHDNYIDFYPDAENFSYEKHTGFTSNGKPQRGWLNEGRGSLSYKYNPRSVMQFLKPNLAWIREHLAPTAYFIDVFSSAGPEEYWTSTGELITREETKKVWGESFAWIRDYLGNNAPQISESGHDQLIGYLDGAQANHLRVESTKDGHPYPFVIYLDCDDHERTCWLDTAHHDRFILHGAGYPGRYAGGLDERIHGIYSDDYISTEVLTGHPGMVSTPFNYEVVRKYWLLSPLMRALAMRTVEQVEFDGGPQGDLHRQHITWSGDVQVWVNRGETDWLVEGRVLPQYGFLARVPTENGVLETSIERREGLIIEQARGAKHLYVNTRPAVDQRLNAKLVVEKVEPEGDHLKISMKAIVHEKAPNGHQLFFHINRGEEIVEQPAHDPFLFSREPGEYRFTITAAVPSYVKSGDQLPFTYGLWDPQSGRRHPLVGHDDGKSRVYLGVFEKPAQDQATNQDIAWHAAPEKYIAQEKKLEQWRKRFNQDNRMIDFGPIVTNGGCRLIKEEKSMTVIPLPMQSTMKETLHQTIQIRQEALPWDLPQLKRIARIDENGTVLSEVEINAEKEADLIEIKHDPTVFMYRLIGE